MYPHPLSRSPWPPHPPKRLKPPINPIPFPRAQAPALLTFSALPHSPYTSYTSYTSDPCPSARLPVPHSNTRIPLPHPLSPFLCAPPLSPRLCVYSHSSRPTSPGHQSPKLYRSVHFFPSHPYPPIHAYTSKTPIKQALTNLLPQHPLPNAATPWPIGYEHSDRTPPEIPIESARMIDVIGQACSNRLI